MKRVLVVLLACAGIVAVPNTTFAATTTVSGVIMSDPNLNRRGGPGTEYNIHGTVAYGSTVNIACFEWGTSITAIWPDGQKWTTTVWDASADSTGRSYGLHVSDAWVNTGGDTSLMVPRCSSIAADPNTYPWPSVGPNTYIADGHGYYEGECTSFPSWEARTDRLPAVKSPDRLGDAHYWTGATSTSVPHVGDVAQWDPNRNDAGPSGHVAYVYAVLYDSASIIVYEYNWRSAQNNYTGHRLNIRTIPWTVPSRYLQF